MTGPTKHRLAEHHLKKEKVNVGYTCTSRILNMYCSALWKQKIESCTKNLTDAPKEISQNRAGAWF